MQVRVQAMNQAASALAGFVERRVRFAMRRRAVAVQQVSVQLQDLNGLQRGCDKECRITLRTESHGTLVVRALAVTWRRAVHAALLRAANLLARVLGRAHARRRTALQPPTEA